MQSLNKNHRKLPIKYKGHKVLLTTSCTNDDYLEREIKIPWAINSRNYDLQSSASHFYELIKFKTLVDNGTLCLDNYRISMFLNLSKLLSFSAFIVPKDCKSLGTVHI